GQRYQYENPGRRTERHQYLETARSECPSHRADRITPLGVAPKIRLTSKGLRPARGNGRIREGHHRRRSINPVSDGGNSGGKSPMLAIYQDQPRQRERAPAIRTGGQRQSDVAIAERYPSENLPFNGQYHKQYESSSELRVRIARAGQRWPRRLEVEP